MKTHQAIQPVLLFEWYPCSHFLVIGRLGMQLSKILSRMDYEEPMVGPFFLCILEEGVRATGPARTQGPRDANPQKSTAGPCSQALPMAPSHGQGPPLLSVSRPYARPQQLGVRAASGLPPGGTALYFPPPPKSPQPPKEEAKGSKRRWCRCRLAHTGGQPWGDSPAPYPSPYPSTPPPWASSASVRPCLSLQVNAYPSARAAPRSYLVAL